MASTFKSPDTDTLTAEKINLTNSKIIDYLVQSGNIEAAKYVRFLISNLNENKQQPNTPYDKLLFVNQKILKVLEDIEKNMIDEQDTSIKHPLSSSNIISSASLATNALNSLNSNALSNVSNNLPGLSNLLPGAASLYAAKKVKDKISRASSKTKSSSKTASKNKTAAKTKQKIRKASNANINKDIKNAKQPLKSNVKPAAKSASKVSKVSSSVSKLAAKSAAKIAGPAAVAIDAAMTISDVMDAKSDAERTEAIAEGAAGTAVGVAGAIALSWIPIVGPLAGYAIGNWIGNWAGQNIAKLFTDPEDSIPDEITRMGPEAELAFLDSILIPKYQNDPNIDEKNRKEDLKSLNEYKQKLQDRIAKGFTQEEKDDFALGKLETAGVFEKNFFGDSEILDWNKLEKCTIKDIDLLINLDDWDDDTLDKLKQVKLLKQNQESENKQKSITTSSIDSINKAIEAEKQNLQQAVEEQDTLEVQKVQSTLLALDQAKQTALQSKEQVDKTIEVKQSALDATKTVKVSKSSNIDYDLTNNNKVQQAEQNLQQNVKMAMASGLGDMSFMMVDNSQMSAEASQAIATMQPSNVKFNPDDGLGAISGKYESNGKPGVISSGKGDIGGKSYGAWQIASKTGTLRAYVNFAKDKYPMLADAPLASNAFDQIWKGIAQKDPQGFLQNQYEFIKKTHYDPVYDYAVSKGLDVSNKAVCSALWSQSVQHGLNGNKRIINWALTEINGSKDPQVIIKALYSARSRYVSGLNMDPDTKASVLKRYQNEVGDALSMNQQIQSGQLQNNAYEQASANARQSQNLTPEVSSTNNTTVDTSPTPTVESNTTVTPSENTQTSFKRQTRESGLVFVDEESNSDKDINAEIEKIDSDIEDLEIDMELNYSLGGGRGYRGTEAEKLDYEKLQELQKRKQELLSQLPSVDKSASENAINTISDNMANNTTLLNTNNNQTILINNSQQPSQQMVRKDETLEPNACDSGVFSNAL